MRSLDEEVEGLVEVPSGTDVFDAFAGRKRCPPAVVEAHRIRCRRGDFAPIVCNEYTGDYRPGVRVGGGLAGERAGVEFGDGGGEVVDVECDDRDDPVVGIDLDYLQDIELKRLRSLVAARVATNEDKALPTA